MLWRFGLQHASNLDKLLEKEDVTLEEVLNDPDLQQELREQTPKLISYLVQPANLKQMVEYIATEDFFKFTKMAGAACEVLCSNSPAFAEGLTAAYVVRDFEESDESETETEEGEQASQHLLQLLWGVMRLEAGQLDAQQATLFSRVMCSLLQRKPYEALDFVRLQGAAVTQFLEHLGVSAVVDLLLKVISLEELEGGPGIIAWLSSHRLVGQLVDRLAPDRDPDTHSLAAQVLLDIIAISQCNNPAQPTIGTNALIAELKSAETVGRLADYMLDREAPHATSTLVNCVYIFIELIRRNYSEADLDDREDDEEEEEEEARVRLPAVDLSEMMGVLADRVGDLVALLRSPRSSIAMVPTTQGLREPLGFERLRICELFAELLHCSNMPRLNVLNNGADSPTVAQARGPEVVLDIGEAAGRTAATTPVGQLLKWRLIEHDVLPLCTDLFFKFSLNNFLHSVVYDVMHQVLNLPLSLECNVALIVTAFRDVRITSRIAQASERNDESMRAPRGVRLGFMGHLSGIGEEVARLLELSGAALEPLIAPYIDGDEWLDYVARTLQEAREREQQPLGGERPGPGFVGAADPTDIDMLSDAGGQVFVSRMGLVDAGAGDAYVDDEDDEDVDDERSSDVPHAALMYPNTEDDEPSDYMTHPSLYFGRSQGEDDEDQFIIRDIDDDSNSGSGSGSNSDSDDDADEEDIGPAGRMGRFRSYQNEIPPAAPSDDEDEDSNVPSDDASNGAQAEAATAQPPVPGAASSDGSDEQGNEGSVAACSDCSAIDDEDDGAGSALPATWEDVEETDACQARRQLNRLSLDGTSAPLELDCEAPDQINGASIAAQDPAPAVSSADEEQPPPMPPRPSDADCASFQDNMARLAAQGSTIKLPALVGGHVESKGLVQSLLQRESKQRSLSSSELDNIVPAGIGRWDPRDSGKASGGGSGSGTGGGNAGADGAVADGVSAQGSESDEGSGRSRSGSFATRRRRSRSQSAGVGISRAMVIQAAVQGQFPYLDAKTCQFVGQLKSDTVTLGGAAASSSSARPRSKPIPPMPSSSPSPSPSPPAMKPASDNVPPIPQRPPSLPPSSLRMRSSAIASDSDDDDVFPPIPPLPSISMPPPSTLRTGLPTPANSVGSQAKQHQHLASSDKSSSLTYAAVAMSSASAGVSALPTPSIVTTGLPSYPLPAAGASKPAPLPMTWAAVASSAAGASHTSSVANGRSAVGGGRDRGQRSISAGSKGFTRVPEFPVLPMSPVGNDSPKLFAAKK